MALRPTDRTTPRRHWLLRCSPFAALLAAAALAGCSTGVTLHSPVTRAPATTTASTPHSTPESASHTPILSARPTRAQAHRVVAAARLQRSDFPGGWSGPDINDYAARSECAGVNHSDAAALTVGTSTFERSEFDYITASVYVFPTPAVARRRFAALSSRSTSACDAHEFQSDLVSGPHDPGVASAPQVNALPIGRFGDQALASRIRMQFVYQAYTSHFSWDLVTVRAHRCIARLLVAYQPGGPQPSVRDAAVRRATKRLEAAC